MSRVLIKSAWGSDDPTKAAFPFLHANAFTEAGHEVQIFLLGEAVGLMRTCVAEAIVPVGWPPLAEALTKTIDVWMTRKQTKRFKRLCRSSNLMASCCANGG